MPIYVYQCIDCSSEWKESHGMTEDAESCTRCESQNIHRVPSNFVNLSKKSDVKRKVGDITNEFIEESKKSLRGQKKELDKKR